MAHQHGGSEENVQTIRAWDLAQAHRASPYIASVMRSLRDNRLEAQRQRRAAELLDARPGRPDRHTIIQREEALRQARLALARFEEAEAELQAIDVYCLDPVNGLALLPFIFEDQLAWFVFDLFDEDPLRHWRLHHDRLDARRPVSEIDGPGPGQSRVA